MQNTVSQEWAAYQNHSNTHPGGHKKNPRTTSTSLAVNDGVMNSAVYQKIPEENVRVLVCTLELKQSWVIHQDDDPNHTSTSEWLKKQKQSEVFGVM